jgi:hypothetical protein
MGQAVGAPSESRSSLNSATASNSAKPHPTATTDLKGRWLELDEAGHVGLIVKFRVGSGSSVGCQFQLDDTHSLPCFVDRRGGLITINTQSDAEGDSVNATTHVLLLKKISGNLKGLVLPERRALELYLEGSVEEANKREQIAATARALVEDAKSGLVWIDPDTNLMWTKKDNEGNNNLNRQQAVNYCQHLSYRGYTDWRLPTIDELKGIADQNQNQHVDCCANRYPGHIPVIVHIKGNILMSNSLELSSTTKSDNDGEWAEAFDYHYDGVFLSPVGTQLGGALCVRMSPIRPRP